MSQKFNVTKAEAAQFFDVSLKTIDAWLRKGMPYVQKGGRGKPWTINLREASKWRDRMADHSSHQWAGKPGIGPVGYEDRSEG